MWIKKERKFEKENEFWNNQERKFSKLTKNFRNSKKRIYIYLNLKGNFGTKNSKMLKIEILGIKIATFWKKQNWRIFDKTIWKKIIKKWKFSDGPI